MTTLSRLALPLALLLSLTCPARAAEVDTSSWRFFAVEHPALGLRYPADWLVLDARTRDARGAKSAQELLAPGQARKLTFREARGGDWAGEFTVEVWRNPKSLSLPRWFAQHAPRDVTGGSLVTDSAPARLGGEPAHAATVFAFDHEEQYWLVRRGGFVILVHCAGENPNDSRAALHSAVYQAMRASLAFPDRVADSGGQRRGR